MRRIVAGLLGLPVVAVVACTGSDPIPGEARDSRVDDGGGSEVEPVVPSTEGGSSTDTDGGLDGDAAADAAKDAHADAEAGPSCKATPPSCLSTMESCGASCKMTYNTCAYNCSGSGNVQPCIEACKANVASCQAPCKGDCVTCANNAGSCTGNPDCQKKVFVP